MSNQEIYFPEECGVPQLHEPEIRFNNLITKTFNGNPDIVMYNYNCRRFGNRSEAIESKKGSATSCDRRKLGFKYFILIITKK